ncbi:MAG TPA: type II toxin-antitoxin system ParD family antitoxin [Dyella sp.]|uniref:ribbon-helix-helix domain-containing protein n=1 Tax=Dyella sp. TaxID=1869338 RepID=UPI002F942A04
MAATQKLSISLPKEQADLVQKLADSGRYASVSAVISDGLRVLQARDAAMEKWLREEVIPAYEELRADPTKGLTTDQARTELARRRKRRA